MPRDLGVGMYVYPGGTCLVDKKYPGTVPCAQSPIWMRSLLLYWLGKLTPWEP